MALISMKLDPKEAKEEAGLCESGDASEGPLYPYGLCLGLNDETLKKLGITDLPDVGEKFTLTALVEVTSTRSYSEQDGTETGMDLQITNMSLDSGQAKDLSTMLYGKS